jgi:hypothetical protein
VAVGDTVGLIEVIKSFTPHVAEQAGVRDPAAFLLDKPLSAVLRQSLRSDGLAGVALRPQPRVGRPLDDPAFDPLFAECARQPQCGH